MRYLAFLFLIFHLVSCADSPTKIERDNPQDPDNPAYELAPASDFKSEILPDKLIKLTWRNSSEDQLATAIIITKTMSADSEAIALDTLDINKSTFIDSSRQVGYDTFYHLTRIRETKGHVTKSEELHTNVQFGTMVNKLADLCCIQGYMNSDIDNFDDDSLRAYFFWEYETEWPFISIAYEVIVEEGTTQFIPLEVLQPGQTSYISPALNLDFKDRRFVVQTFTSENDISNNKIIDSLSVNFTPSSSLAPILNEPSVYHESKITLSWKDKSSFEDGFEILRGYNQNNLNVIATVDPNVTTFTDTLQPFLPQTGTSGGRYFSDYSTFYSVRAIKNNSSVITETERADIRIYVADLQVSDYDENSITLNWELRQPSDIHSFTLLRSTDGDNYEPYKKLETSQNTYTDTDLDTTQTYHYLIRSDIKNGFGNPTLSYSYAFNELASFDFKNASALEVSENDNYLIAISGYDSETSSNNNELVIYNLDTNTEFYRIDPFNNPIDGVDILEGKNLIAYSSKEAKKIEVRDFIADTTVFSVSDLEVHDIEFSPDGQSVYTVSELSNFKKYDLGNTNPVFDIQTTEQFYSFPAKRRISVSPTGDTIAVNMASKYHLYSPEGNRISFNSLSTQGNTSDWVNISNKGEFIASTREFANSTRTQVQSLESGSELFLLRGVVSSFDFSYSDQLALATTPEDIYLIDLNTISFAGAYHFTDDWSDEGITFSRFSNTNNTFYIANSLGIEKMRITNTRKWQPAAYIPSISTYFSDQ